MLERDLVLIALFAALIAALGFLPQLTLMSGVPISAQSLGVMLCGTVLGARRGALAVCLLVLIVALGLPVLAGGRGGLGVFASPTVGFLLGFVPAACATGLIMERARRLPVGVAAGLASATGGILVLYVFGTIGMMLTLQKGVLEALLLTTPFIPGDIVKAAIAGWLTHVIARARPELLLTRQPA